MNDYEKSIDNIKKVATALDDLLPQFIFIGGATVGLYATIEGAINARPTKDIDILAETFSLSDYEELEVELRKKGFANDIESDVICRWRLGFLVVDIMYPHPKKFGFVNRWYEEAIEHTVDHIISEEITIKIFNVIYFMATKIEAYRNRGEDCRWDSDFADIIYVLGNRSEFDKELLEASDSVKKFIIEYFAEIVDQDIYDCILASAPDIGGEEGVNFVNDLIEKIASYGKE